MANKISAPYNFVPLNEYVFIPSWAGNVSQDIPFEDGEDGYIEVTWKNVSPLCIRDASADRNKGYSMHVMMPDGKRLYFIPGSSLRGMLRNTLSIMSFGKMTQYADRNFGYRKFGGNNDYVSKMGNVRYGWLSKDTDGFKLYKCIEEAGKISIDDVASMAENQKYKTLKSAWDRNDAIAGNTFPEYEANGVRYRIFATGQMQKKGNELLIPVEVEPEPVVFKPKDNVIKSFMTIYEKTPGFDKYCEMLDRGKKIPVSYIEKDGGYILGMGRMIRYPYDYGVTDLVNRKQKKLPDGIHDLADVIFGWVDGNDSMKGRVQIGNAFSLLPLGDDELCQSVKGVLGTPQASYYPLYVQQDRRDYKTYSSANATISGRKLYRIHKGGTTTQLPQGNDNESTMSTITPVPAGQTFRMRIVVHNMKKVEIGALLSAISYNNTPDVWHNIGSAKGYGYGKLECSGVSLHELRYSEEDYLRAYEYEMTSFTKEKYGCLWGDTLQNKQLLSIMSEHDDSDVRMMEMDKKKSPLNENEYEHYKKNENFSTLSETGRSMNSYFDVADFKRRSFKEKNAGVYEKIKEAEDLANFNEALALLGQLTDRMNIEGIDKAEEEKWMETIQQKKQKEEDDRKAVERALEAARKENVLSAGLDAFINEKYDGNGKYKVDKWKTCGSKISQWLKIKKAKELDESEIAIIEGVIRRLHSNPNRSEAKDWKAPADKSRIWKTVGNYLGEERMQAMYKELIG